MESDIVENYNKYLIGIKSICGITIKGVSKHATERFIERNISVEQTIDVLKNSNNIYPGNIINTVCQQKDNCRIVINKKTGNIISAVLLSE